MFGITGQPGNIVQDVINVSPDGVFVAVAVGYGFEEERGRSLGLSPSPDQVPPLPGDVRLGDIPPSALLAGFRINPRFESLVFTNPTAESNGSRGPLTDLVFSDLPLTPNLLFADGSEAIFQRVKAPEEISFLFSIVDSSSGRELQDEPTHNLASLGKSNGERPFRLLAQPITFLPRSSIRLQIIERTEGITGTLFIVLYGYKVLGSSACPEPVARTLTGPPSCSVESIGRPSDRVIPFDYVTTIALSGRPKNLIENETTVSVEGGFVATSIGYGLSVEEREVVMQWDRVGEIEKANSVSPRRDAFQSLDDLRRDWLEDRRTNPAHAGPPPALGNLADLPLRMFSPGALMDGIRIRRQFVRIAFRNDGALATNLPITWLDEMFERLNQVEDVSFRYSLFDGGRGRELQNQPLHNVAGLGIANGHRPFKRLARPLVFLPRSTIRIQIEERFGRGTLFVALQGYKILGSSGRGGRS